MTDTTLSQALAEREQAPEQKRALDLLARSKPQVEQLLARSPMNADEFAVMVRAAMFANPLLHECDPNTVLGACLRCAQLGLELGPLGFAYLVPFKREAQLIVGYRGWIELAYRSERVKSVSAELVHQGDTFRVAKGTAPKITHEPAGPAGDSAIVAAYATAKLSTGGVVFNVIYEEDWERARQASQTGRKNTGPWNEHRPAMIRKTAIRRLEPWLPKTPALALALTADEQPARLDDLVEAERSGGLPAPSETPQEADDVGSDA